MNLGAFDYVIKPDDFQSLFRKLQPLIAEVLAITRPAKEVEFPPRRRPARRPRPMLVGKSPPMIEVYKLIGRFARSDDAVLILGETGTGKELVARAIHTQQPAQEQAVRRPQLRRAHRDPAGERAVRPREGRLHRRRPSCARASSSTPTAARSSSTRSATCRSTLQAKLLRVLEDSEVERVGGNEPIKVDVRVLSATHRDLEAAIAGGDVPRRPVLPAQRRDRPPAAAARALGDLPELRDYFLAGPAKGDGKPARRR